MRSGETYGASEGVSLADGGGGRFMSVGVGLDIVFDFLWWYLRCTSNTAGICTDCLFFEARLTGCINKICF